MTIRRALIGALIMMVAILGVTALKAIFEDSETNGQIESPGDRSPE